MELVQLKEFFMWCTVINLGILLWWAAFISVGTEFVYSWHSKFIKISKEQFLAIHYAGIAFYKLSLFILVFVPYMALYLID